MRDAGTNERDQSPLTYRADERGRKIGLTLGHAENRLQYAVALSRTRAMVLHAWAAFGATRLRSRSRRGASISSSAIAAHASRGPTEATRVFDRPGSIHGVPRGAGDDAQNWQPGENLGDGARDPVRSRLPPPVAPERPRDIDFSDPETATAVVRERM